MSISDIVKKINIGRPSEEKQAEKPKYQGRRGSLYTMSSIFSLIFGLTAIGEGIYLISKLQRPYPIEITCDPKQLADMEKNDLQTDSNPSKPHTSANLKPVLSKNSSKTSLERVATTSIKTKKTKKFGK